MEKDSARTLVQKKPNDNKLSYRIVENAGHQIIFDNSERMAHYILEGATERR